MDNRELGTEDPTITYLQNADKEEDRQEVEEKIFSASRPQPGDKRAEKAEALTGTQVR